MGTVSVNQIFITPLKRIQVSGGDVLHGMKCSDPDILILVKLIFQLLKVAPLKRGRGIGG